RIRHTRWPRDWSSDVCSSDLPNPPPPRIGCAGEARARTVNTRHGSLDGRGRDRAESSKLAGRTRRTRGSGRLGRSGNKRRPRTRWEERRVGEGGGGGGETGDE